MTIQWGAYENASGTGLRCGIQIESVTTPTNGSGTFVVTFSCWTQNSATYSDNQTFDLSTSGGVSASLSDNSIPFFNGENTTATKRGSNQTATYTYSTYGTSPGSIHINATINGTFNGVTPSVTAVVTVPARPWANADPTTAASASRTSDTQAAVSWTNHDATSKAYNQIKLYRSANGGAYALVSTLGVVSSTNDTTIAANNKYLYRPNVLGKNGVEITGDVTDTAIWTTPGAPTGCTAAKQANGDILVSWANHVNYTEYTTRVEHSTNGGSSWSELTSVANGVTSYTHVTPGTGTTHTYRVRSRSTTGSLNSSYSTSNTVTLLSTANPPTGLSPSGVARDASGNIVLTWTHNPADGTPQSKYQLQYKVDAGSYATVGPTTSGVSSYTITAGTLTNGHTITWHVETAGENGTLSGYSSDATFTTAAEPTVSIDSPSGGAYDSSSLTVEWTYFQAQSSAQATWQAQLLDSGAHVLETLTGTTESEATFATPLADATDYTVTVTATAANGLVSDAAAEDFTVAYLPPAAVTITGEYDNTGGTVALTITGDDPVGGVTEAIDTVDVQRSLDGGVTWVTIAAGIVLAGDPLDANVIDTVPTLNGTNTYRVIAYSALPSSAMSDPTDVAVAEQEWGYLNNGDGFATVARVSAMPSYESATARARLLYHFAGRAKPVQFEGEALSQVLSVGGKLTAGSATMAEFEAMGRATGVFCWRDPTGRRIFGSLGPMAVKTTSKYDQTVAFALTEVDFGE